MLTSLDNLDIAESTHMLLTVGARERNTDYATDYNASTIQSAGRTPAISEAVEGNMTIKSTDAFTIYILNASGERLRTAETHTDSNGFTVLELSAADKTLHYELVRE